MFSRFFEAYSDHQPIISVRAQQKVMQRLLRLFVACSALVCYDLLTHSRHSAGDSSAKVGHEINVQPPHVFSVLHQRRVILVDYVATKCEPLTSPRCNDATCEISIQTILKTNWFISRPIFFDELQMMELHRHFVAL